MIYLSITVGNIGSAAAGIILQTASTGSITGNIYDPPIVIHCVLLGCCRKIGTG